LGTAGAELEGEGGHRRDEQKGKTVTNLAAEGGLTTKTP
jgi:hypothetical protein